MASICCRDFRLISTCEGSVNAPFDAYLLTLTY